MVHKDTRRSSRKDDISGSSMSRDFSRTALTTMREGGIGWSVSTKHGGVAGGASQNRAW